MAYFNFYNLPLSPDTMTLVVPTEGQIQDFAFTNPNPNPDIYVHIYLSPPGIVPVPGVSPRFWVINLVQTQQRTVLFSRPINLYFDLYFYCNNDIDPTVPAVFTLPVEPLILYH